MISFLDLKAINAAHRDELIEACARVIDSGWYIAGNELLHFENEFAEYCGSRHCIGVANGLDALILLHATWTGLLNTYGWPQAALNGLLALGFAYFAFPKKGKRGGNSRRTKSRRAR